MKLNLNYFAAILLALLTAGQVWADTAITTQNLMGKYKILGKDAYINLDLTLKAANKSSIKQNFMDEKPAVCEGGYSFKQKSQFLVIKVTCKETNTKLTYNVSLVGLTLEKLTSGATVQVAIPEMEISGLAMDITKTK